MSLQHAHVASGSAVIAMTTICQRVPLPSASAAVLNVSPQQQPLIGDNTGKVGHNLHG
jgi:hypothetical protein